MRPQSCTVGGSLALVLRIMRVLSLAPLTIARERAGYRIRVCKRYAYVGYICAIFFNVFHGAWVFVDMNISSDYYSTLHTHIPLLLFLVLSNMLVVALITLQGSLFSVSRMNKLIEHVIYMEKAIPTNTKEVSNKNKRLLIFMIISRVFIDTVNCIRIFNIRELSEFKIYNYILRRIKYLLVCSMQMYVFIIYEEILFKIRVVREELQDQADFLEFEYVPSPGFTQWANTKLQKIGEKLDCIRKIFTRMNQCNEYAVFFLYICIVSRLLEVAFEFVSFLQKPLALNTITYLFIITHYIFLLIILIEPFRGIDLEMQAMKLQVGRIATTDYVTDSIPAPLEMLYDELSTMDLSFSPLGVFTINRSLLAKTFGAAISYLTIIFQFRSSIQD